MPLRGTGSSVLLNVPSEALREWLARTWEAVPSGEEHARITWDAILSALLSKWMLVMRRRETPVSATSCGVFSST